MTPNSELVIGSQPTSCVCFPLPSSLELLYSVSCCIICMTPSVYHILDMGKSYRTIAEFRSDKHHLTWAHVSRWSPWCPISCRSGRLLPSFLSLCLIQQIPRAWNVPGFVDTVPLASRNFSSNGGFILNNHADQYIMAVMQSVLKQETEHSKRRAGRPLLK